MLLLASSAFSQQLLVDAGTRLLRDADASYQAHRPAEAAGIYREYLARYADRADVRVFLGAALFSLDKPQEALEEARRALALDKSYGRAYTLAGRIYAGQQAWELAQQAFTSALRLDARDKDTWYFSGRAYYEESRFDQALEAFEKVRALGGEQGRVYQNLGLTYEAVTRFEEAEKAYKHALEIAPGEYGPYLAYGVFLHKQGRPAEAIHALTKALVLGPGEVEVRFELGKVLYQSGQLEEAAGVLEPALALVNQCRLHNLLVNIYSRQGKSEAADRHVEALEGCPIAP